ncbi:hypothetical protein PLESTM_001013600 [Pleodorina starrii]|nr:hypothetical protein PLESTM_001013600 [Pleodorina starrii]
MHDGYGCFGGYATNLDYATKLGYSSSCNKTCRGEGYQICGGFWTNSIYLTGDAIISAPNLALARPAYASSVYTTAAVAYLPAKAVDGVVQYFTGLNETNPQVFASAANDRSPWISVDLAAPTVILSIVIWNRCDFYWRNLQNAELRIGNASITVPGDSISSNPLVWTQNKQLGMCAAEIVMFDTPKVGRWVTLQNRNPTALNLDYSLQLTELQVFGVPYVDFCSADPCRGAPCTNLGNTWSCDYLGCYADSSATRMVQAPMYDGRLDRFMTPQICRDRARSRGFTLFSVQDGYGCFGGYATNLDYATKLGYSSSCNKTCRGEGYQICGGFWTNSIYLTGDVLDRLPNLALARPAYASSVYTTAAVAYLPAKAVDGVVQYFTGLNETNPQVFASAANDRSPWISVDLAAPTVILSIVIWNRCDFYWRNLQNAELRIGNASITVPGDSISSNPLVWTQNKQLGMCAAEIVMFDTPKVGRWVTLQNRNPTALNLDYSLQLTELQVFGVPYGDYLGCYADSSATRMVQAPMYDGRLDRFMTPQICRDRARSRGFTLFSVQDGYGCFGGYATNLDYATKLGYSSSCNKTCRGEGYQICGGFWTNSIYLTGDVLDRLPNLALARPAYASSVYTTAAVAYLPAKAVDGVVQYFTGLNETNPQVFASAANDRSPWISVDLAAPTVILSIVIWNRCDFYWRNLQNAELRIGNASITVPGDSISSNPLVWTQNKQLGMCAAEIVMFDTPKVGRWVTLQNRNPTALNLDYSLQLTELQVFGF